MKKSIIIGIISSVIFGTLGITTGYPSLFTYISGGIGLACLLMACIFSGVFVSGDKIRANNSTESEGDRKKRTNFMFICVWLGSPNFLVAILLTIYLT